MTLNEVKALKVGDMIRYHDSLSNMETLEIVIEEWGKYGAKDGLVLPVVSASLQTVAVINEGDDDDDKANIGDEGWINEYNYGCFERIA